MLLPSVTSSVYSNFRGDSRTAKGTPALCFALPWGTESISVAPAPVFLDGYYKRGGRHNGMDSIAEWCNGNTNDSDSFILGSNPSSAATKTFVRIFRQRFLFLFSFYSPVSLHTIILKQPRQSGIISMIKQKNRCVPQCVCCGFIGE